MRKKSFWVILLTAILFLSATVLGVSTVYRVDDVRVDIVALSQEGDAESKNLQKRLQQLYYKQSIFFAYFVFLYFLNIVMAKHVLV